MNKTYLFRTVITNRQTDRQRLVINITNPLSDDFQQNDRNELK